MSDVATLFFQLAAGLLTLGLTHPPVGLGAAAVWWAGIRAAKRAGIKAGTGGDLLLPFAALVWLWRHRRDMRELIAASAMAGLGALWMWAIIYSETVRVRVLVATFFAGLVAAGIALFCYLEGRAPTLANIREARAQGLREWDAQRTVQAVADDGVRVEGVRAEGDAVVATVTVAAGASPADLEAVLMERLAAAVHRITGRQAVAVDVTKTGTPGVFRVRVDTGHPLREVVLWRDLPRR